MNAPDFEGWVALYIQTTGCDSERVAEILLANQVTFIDRWHATYEELCESTQRLIEDRKVPKFANEHTNAIGNELLALRAERTRREQTERTVSNRDAPVVGCDCPKCMPPNGSEKWQRVAAELKRRVAAGGSLTGGVFKEVPRR